MLIVGDNLRDLCIQHAVVSNLDSYDVTSLTLRLNIRVISINTEAVVDYGKPLKPSWINEFDVPEEGIELKRNVGLLGCSEEVIQMPIGYFGLVQTKGSLARLFVSATCNDGQIDSGFCGRVTFELLNLGHLKVRIPRLAPVAQLFILRTSTKNVPSYAGRYMNAEKPTVYKPKLS